MRQDSGENPLRFLFDQHVSGPALRQLRERGIDVMHVAEVGLAEADDPVVFQWAIREWRIVVTRNYCDFAPLVEVSARRGVSFPGVLFIPTSIRQNDVGLHVRALLAWMEAAAASGSNPVENSSDWVRSPRS
jgi:predicted nuclease of predicted toxin-antitoxin system